METRNPVETICNSFHIAETIAPSFHKVSPELVKIYSVSEKEQFSSKVIKLMCCLSMLIKL